MARKKKHGNILDLIDTQDVPITNPLEAMEELDQHATQLESARARVQGQIDARAQAEQSEKEEDEYQTRHFWPKGKELPREYLKIKARTQPCPKCRRVLLDFGGQAVSCLSSREDVAFFRCKSCSHRWKLGVKEAK